MPNNWCFWVAILEKTLESSLDCKEVKPVSPKENKSWIFIGRTDGEAEAPILWPPDAKSQLIRRDPDAGKDWRQEEKVEDVHNRGWDGWMASPTQWTWVWESSGTWWRTGKPGLLQSMGSQIVGRDWVSEQRQQQFKMLITWENLLLSPKENGQLHWFWSYFVSRIMDSPMENSIAVPLKTKNRIAIWSSNPLPGYIFRGNTNLKWYMHPNVHNSIIDNSQDMEAT